MRYVIGWTLWALLTAWEWVPVALIGFVGWKVYQGYEGQSIWLVLIEARLWLVGLGFALGLHALASRIIETVGNAVLSFRLPPMPRRDRD